jgi:hypothetical protein
LWRYLPTSQDVHLARVTALVTTAAMAIGLAAGAATSASWPTMSGSTPTSAPTPRLIPPPATAGRDYAMFTPAGNEAVRTIVVEAADRLTRNVDREDVLERVRDRWVDLARLHPEAYDNAVRATVADQLDRFLRAAGDESVDSLDEVAAA